MNQQDDPNRQAAQKRRGDRGKMIFLVIIVVAVAVIYWSQQSDVGLPKWPGDVDKALAEGKAENRRILLFFAGKPPSETARRMSRKTLKHNRARLRKDKIICVLVRAKRDGDLAKKYKVSEFPTFILLDNLGKELNRRVGFIGEVAFRDSFLDCTKVQKP